MTERKRVLILCTGNSARSQMAEGLLREMADDRFALKVTGWSTSTFSGQLIDTVGQTGIAGQSTRTPVDENA